MTQQHYRLTLKQAIAHYNNGLITTPGLLYFYLKIRLAPGWKCTLHQREITEKLGISRAAFYKAIAKLSELGLIEFETPNGVTVTLSTIGDTSLRLETPSLRLETPSLRLETPSLRLETLTPSNPPSVKASSPSSNSYQIFFDSLSDLAREKFLNFVREKTAHFSQPINDLEAWLAGVNGAGQARFRVYYAMFQSEVGSWGRTDSRLGIAPEVV
jgi:DNA-binding MarR family transcriptional regulator